MNTQAVGHAPGSLVQPFMEDLIARSGIAPGMRVLVLGAGRGDVAFLAAERVGPSGVVVGLDSDADALVHARRRAHEQYFPQVSFELKMPSAPVPQSDTNPTAVVLETAANQNTSLEYYDAVVARFYLMRCADPVAAIQSAGACVRPGGRIVFAEWHLESVLWDHASSWPASPQYRRYARVVLSALRREGVHVDMGLRLVNAFADAGLPLPALRTDLRAIVAGSAAGSDPFASALPELLACERQRLAERVIPTEGHVFAPLLVGAWTRKPA